MDLTDTGKNFTEIKMEIGQENSSEASEKNTENTRRRKKKKDVTPVLKEEGKVRNTMEEVCNVTCRDPEGITTKKKGDGQKKNKKSKVVLRKAGVDEALDPTTGKKDLKKVKV